MDYMDYIQIEKDNKRFQGALYLFEGELMKIIVKKPQAFSAGDLISCFYNDVKFESKILKKAGNHIYILVPQFYEQFSNEKRKHPRIHVDIPAYICVPHKNKHGVSEKLPIQLIDVSREGIGFLTNNSLKLNGIYQLFCESIHLTLKAEVIIRNKRDYEGKIRYGCQIKSLSKEGEFQLRKLILIHN